MADEQQGAGRPCLSTEETAHPDDKQGQAGQLSQEEGHRGLSAVSQLAERVYQPPRRSHETGVHEQDVQRGQDQRQRDAPLVRARHHKRNVWDFSTVFHRDASRRVKHAAEEFVSVAVLRDNGAVHFRLHSGVRRVRLDVWLADRSWCYGGAQDALAILRIVAHAPPWAAFPVEPIKPICSRVCRNCVGAAVVFVHDTYIGRALTSPVWETAVKVGFWEDNAEPVRVSVDFRQAYWSPVFPESVQITFEVGFV